MPEQTEPALVVRLSGDQAAWLAEQMAGIRHVDAGDDPRAEETTRAILEQLGQEVEP